MPEKKGVRGKPQARTSIALESQTGFSSGHRYETRQTTLLGENYSCSRRLCCGVVWSSLIRPSFEFPASAPVSARSWWTQFSFGQKGKGGRGQHHISRGKAVICEWRFSWSKIAENTPLKVDVCCLFNNWRVASNIYSVCFCWDDMTDRLWSSVAVSY